MEKVVLSRKVHLRSLNFSELKLFLRSVNSPNYRAIQILDWLHKKHVMNFSEMKNLPKEFQSQLSERATARSLELIEIVGATGFIPSPLVRQKPDESVLRRMGEGEDGGKNEEVHPHLNPPPSRGRKKHIDRDSIKYLMKTYDGHILESVLIIQKDRRTICLSTQLGCRIRCTFCASGKGRFGRNLTAGEMVEQVSVISRDLSIVGATRRVARTSLRGLRPSRLAMTGKITNIVFMGMGEPLDNYEATMRAVEILTAEWGFGLGGRRITVSTSGLTPRIEQFVRDSRGRVRLSISLHSSSQETRSRLVPINKKYRLDELIQTLEKIHRTLKREITFEYTLIDGVNDSIQEARGVARIASRLGAKVNIIPYNPIREMDYKTPSRERVESFRKLLEEKHVRVIVRQTAGRDIDAACGQLRLDRTI